MDRADAMQVQTIMDQWSAAVRDVLNARFALVEARLERAEALILVLAERAEERPAKKKGKGRKKGRKKRR